MKILLKLEELGLFVLIVYLVHKANPYSILIAFILFWLPDLGMLGYLVNNKVGAYTYNLIHHRGLLCILVLLGYVLDEQKIIFFGLIFLAHSNFDRILGYGLKHTTGFNDTHLGKIGRK